jgi:hypothetical protein
MSLDITLMDDGFPDEYVPLSVDDHFAIINIAKSINLILWLRMENYYEGAEYGVQEVPLLIDETQKLKSCINEIKLIHQVELVLEVLYQAKLNQKSISALSD